MDWRLYIATLLAIAGIVIGVLLFTDDVDPEHPAGSEGVAADTGQSRSPPRLGSFPQESKSLSRGERGDPLPGGSNAVERGSARPAANDRHIEEQAAAADSDDPMFEPTRPDDPADMGPADAPAWNDPVNQRVLGDERWMAPVSAEENAKIDEIFERSRELREDPGLSRLDRLTSIEAARIVIDACYDVLVERRPGIEGRLIVRWTAGANEQGGWADSAEITVNYKLDDPEFAACVIDGVNRMKFPAQPAEAVVVEYPFFYDGSF